MKSAGEFLKGTPGHNEVFTCTKQPSHYSANLKADLAWCAFLPEHSQSSAVPFVHRRKTRHIQSATFSTLVA